MSSKVKCYQCIYEICCSTKNQGKPVDFVSQLLFILPFIHHPSFYLSKVCGHTCSCLFPMGDSNCMLQSSVNHLSFHKHHTTVYANPYPQPQYLKTDFTIRSYGITLMTFPTFFPCCSPSLPLCDCRRSGGLPPLPDAPAQRTCGRGIIGLQLWLSNELALIWRMTPFTFV